MGYWRIREIEMASAISEGPVPGTILLSGPKKLAMSAVMRTGVFVRYNHS